MTLDGAELLVVDDNPALADNMREIFGDLGASVRVASSLAEARELEVDSLDVAVVDVQLPDGSGTDLVPELRSRSRGAEVVLLTGHGSLEDAAAAVGTGAYAYVLKPVQPRLLISNVVHAVRQVRSTRELRQKEEALRVAQRTEAVARLVEEVAHDFNNLLTVIRGYAKAVSGDAGDCERLLSHGDGIHRCTVRGAELTKQLLSYSRRKAAAPRSVDPNDVIEELARLWAHVTSANVNVSLDLDDELGPIHADVGQLEQVLMNLVINARDAMPTGGDLVVTTADCLVVNGRAKELGVLPRGYACLSVADTGSGMDEETRVRATQTFFTTKGDKGTGLGLSTVSSIVREHGGALEIQSAPGRGTRVDVYLPLDGHEPPTSRGSSEAAPGRDVLLVEDEDLLRLAARIHLEDAGYRVVEAASATEAQERIDSGLAVDVLVTDLGLKDGSGVELARRLADARPGLRVLIMTGDREPSGCEGFVVIEKPFDLESLSAVVERVQKGTYSGHARPTVLIVEDEPSARAALASLLEVSMDVIAVGSGSAALDVVRRRHRSFDVLLTDLSLPDIGGLSLAERVREMHPETPVLFMSGYSQPKLPSWARFVSKPIEFDLLERTLEELCAKPSDTG